MLVLALRSSQPHKALEHAGVEVEWSSNTWHKMVKIKADENDSVELLLEDREGMRLLSTGVDYH